ncbi:uncharacterized protein SPPG_08265 [Spizellomyces punctatus DAOM BR117]|uniref:MAPEG family protein n=1 Tax=Spizellomyces punctatus (strain DAOM BR117) TaxID=645134 RepID=A0A0L0H4D2_SPIPD|nr:uncharacterized protein SPPG_08265 [Spizellomyces punctatus DAOM BR117]KNC96365.1 hypothetical protein SPPG_08265 [Spizellomyces punctatus DAOM BR117]|eukprot:XP_016604405.1 hypothetical protein SPPG_08265 [Spizellomyces punctatus DAOM BR117]
MPSTTTLYSLTALSAPVFALGAGISLLRNQQKRPFGTKDDPTDPLTKLVVAHRNATEYAGVLVPLILVVDARCRGRAVDGIVIGAVVCRSLVIASLATCRSLTEVGIGRLVGAWGTYIFGGILAFLPLCF